MNHKMRRDFFPNQSFPLGCQLKIQIRFHMKSRKVTHYYSCYNLFQECEGYECRKRDVMPNHNLYTFQYWLNKWFYSLYSMTERKEPTLHCFIKCHATFLFNFLSKYSFIINILDIFLLCRMVRDKVIGW